jgi:hypothetical protein
LDLNIKFSDQIQRSEATFYFQLLTEVRVRDAEGGEAGTALPSVESVIASPFLERAKQSTSLRWAKPEAISYWIVEILFEIASLTAFIRNDGCFTSFAMTIRRGLPKR